MQPIGRRGACSTTPYWPGGGRHASVPVETCGMESGTAHTHAHPPPTHTSPTLETHQRRVSRPACKELGQVAPAVPGRRIASLASQRPCHVQTRARNVLRAKDFLLIIISLSLLPVPRRAGAAGPPLVLCGPLLGKAPKTLGCPPLPPLPVWLLDSSLSAAAFSL
jgi:hypothetical protein